MFSACVECLAECACKLVASSDLSHGFVVFACDTLVAVYGVHLHCVAQLLWERLISFFQCSRFVCLHILFLPCAFSVFVRFSLGIRYSLLCFVSVWLVYVVRSILSKHGQCWCAGGRGCCRAGPNGGCRSGAGCCRSAGDRASSSTSAIGALALLQ